MQKQVPFRLPLVLGVLRRDALKWKVLQCEIRYHIKGAHENWTGNWLEKYNFAAEDRDYGAEAVPRTPILADTKRRDKPHASAPLHWVCSINFQPRYHIDNKLEFPGMKPEEITTSDITYFSQASIQPSFGAARSFSALQQHKHYIL